MPVDRPNTLAELARRVSRGEQQFDVALSEFLDSFYVSTRRQALIDPVPEFLADRVQQALLGAVGEHLARRWNLAIPAWTGAADRFLNRPYFTTNLESLKALLLVESPIAFRRRLLFVSANALDRASMHAA